MNAREYLKGLNEHDPVWDTAEEYEYTEDQLINFTERYHEKQLKLLRIGAVSFELPSDDIFDMPEVDLKNPLEEFYYYERPAYLVDACQKQFRERLQKALNYLKGN
jgi:hypothetical protein